MITNGTPAIQTVGLTKVFRDFWHRARVVAVDRLDLDVQPNEVFGMLGPNGSGKSTTIKMLLGLLYPTRGRIAVLGKAPTDVAIKQRIGYMPEESYLYPFLNARETLDYYGRLFQIPRPDRVRRVDQLLEMVGLTRESRRRVGEYSKGMARRIGLAQALINDPDLLILDEPTTGLDPIGTREIKDLLTFLNKEKRKTILLSSHLLADVEDVCQRITVLYGGRCQTVGPVRELLRQQDLTQITADKLSDEALARIRDIIETEENKQVLDISAPSDKLETFFLRIVREAQQTQQRTSGVTASGRIAEFLAAPEGEEVVESLMAAAETKPEEPITEPTPGSPREAPAADVIEDLVSTAAKPTPQAPIEEMPPPARPVDEDADGSVIDDLIAPGREEDTDQASKE